MKPVTFWLGRDKLLVNPIAIGSPITVATIGISEVAAASALTTSSEAPISTFGFNDLLSGQGFVGNLYNSKASQYPIKPRYPDSVFTPDAMAGEGVR